MESNEYCTYKPVSSSSIFYRLSGLGHETYNMSNAVLFLVYAGELTINSFGESICLNKGEYAFVKKYVAFEIDKKNGENEEFCAVFIRFDNHFLQWFYSNKCIHSYKPTREVFNQNIIKLPFNSCLQSLYISLEAYDGAGAKPTIDVLSLKLQESIYCLTTTDKRFVPCLFDFVYYFDSSIYNLLNKNV